MDLVTYTFFFWPFFLKFLGFFPAVIFLQMILFDTSNGLLINNKLNKYIEYI
jgi:hypothetical protein